MSSSAFPALDALLDQAADVAATEWVMANCPHAFETLGPCQRERYRGALVEHFRADLVKAYMDSVAALDLEQPLPYRDPMKALRSVAA